MISRSSALPETTIILMADAVLAAKANQKTPDGFYNEDRPHSSLGNLTPSDFAAQLNPALFGLEVERS